VSSLNDVLLNIELIHGVDMRNEYTHQNRSANAADALRTCRDVFGQLSVFIPVELLPF
jgi:hypothetical protein